MKFNIKTMIKEILPYGIVNYITRSSLKSFLLEMLPYGIVSRKIHKKIEMIILGFIIPPFISKTRRQCPICGIRLKSFDPYLTLYRQSIPEMRCPRCWSQPRHRKLWVYLKRKTNFFKNKRASFLHVAPEKCFLKRFQKKFRFYFPVDLNIPGMIKMDITNIEYPDESFDTIFCNHVFEHIPDDNKAISELYRVMKKGGLAVLLVPMAESYDTYEDWSIITPKGRAEAFGQFDHVRRYGQDYLDKLKSAGFIVSAITYDNYMSSKELLKYSGKDTERSLNQGITSIDVIVACSK